MLLMPLIDYFIAFAFRHARRRFDAAIISTLMLSFLLSLIIFTFIFAIALLILFAFAFHFSRYAC